VAESRGGSEGFALMAVLWVVVAAGALALAARLAARDLIASARNRGDLARAEWAAEGCAERARAAVHRAFRSIAEEGPESGTWARLDAVVDSSRLIEGCRVRLIPIGATLDVNQADAVSLRRLLRAAGARSGQADSLSEAILDWRDPDGEARPNGAEAPHYARLGRLLPRDAPFEHPAELRRVRGMEHFPGIDSLLGVEEAPVAIGRAPAPVLAALPGMSGEAVALLADARDRGTMLGLVALSSRLSPGPRAELQGSFALLAERTTLLPEAWLVQASGRVGEPPVTMVVELMLTRAGDRAAIVRRRTWME
jgi:type II secretory pathway component PulK